MPRMEGYFVLLCVPLSKFRYENFAVKIRTPKKKKKNPNLNVTIYILLIK